MRNLSSRIIILLFIFLSNGLGKSLTAFSGNEYLLESKAYVNYTITITSPHTDDRFVLGEEALFEVSVNDDSVSEDNICWSSDIDGNLGCSSSISKNDLSPGTHQISAEANGSTDEVSIRVFDDLWELYQTEPSQAEIDRILDDFNFEWVDSEDVSWDQVGFDFFDADEPTLSRLPFIAKLDVLRRQQFTEQPVFIGNHNTIYEWVRETIHTIELRLDCGNASGGGGIASFPQRLSHWGPINGGSNCGQPWDNYYFQSYLGSLSLLMHEVRHNEPDDPGHISFERRLSGQRSGDDRLENGSGFAWAAKYLMWVFKYSMLDPDEVRHGYVNENVQESARANFVGQLEVIYGDDEPKHSNPMVQDILDEVQAPALFGPLDSSDELSISQEFSWEEKSQAENYLIQVFRQDGGTAVIWERLNDPFYQPSTDELEPGESYFWRVSYRDGKGRSLWSDIWSFSTTEFQAPGELSITVQPGIAELNWSQFDLEEVTSYLILKGEHITNMDVFDKVDPTVTTYTDDVNEPIAFYAVSAEYEADNISEPSNIVSYYHDNLPLTDAWQLVSLPIDTVSVELNNFQIFSFNRTYQNVSLLETGRGYWVRSDTGENLNVIGEGLLKSEINLNEGWNLIGGLAGKADVTSIEDPESLLTPTPVYAYSNGAYEESTTLEPGFGYWIFASDVGGINIKLEAALAEEGSVVAKNKLLAESYHTITFGNGLANQEFIVSERSAEPDVHSRFMLPPVSPSPVLDVRTSTGYRFTDIRSAAIEINSAKYPVSVKLKSPEQDVESDQVYRLVAREDGNEIHFNLLPGASVQLEKEYDELVLEKVHRDEVIAEFAITPNYPNPFNPTTEIRYQIANQADVSIMVFDILGRRVATLVNSQQQAGVYTVTFDANNLASGVYMLRIHAGDFMDLQKMTLIK